MATRKHAKKTTREGTISAKSAFVVLVAALLLSGLNLVLMISEVGELNGLSDSWDTLHANYGARTPSNDAAAAMSADTAEKTPMPEVVWSVVKYRDGEQAMLWTSLVQPLLANYSADGSLRVVLIERKTPSSKDVNVRLFFADGTETSYLWPSTHADAEGMWTMAK